jgi:hypothetical protein
MVKCLRIGYQEYIWTWKCRRLHNEELYDLHSTPGIIRVINSRRMNWLGHVARMGDRSAYRICWEDLMERDHLKDPGVEGRITIKWMLKKWVGEAWTMPHDKDSWWALVNTVMNLRVP